MTDELGLFDERHADHEYRPRRSGRGRNRRTRRRVVTVVSTLVIIALIAGGVWFGLTQVLGLDLFGYDDYEGGGERDVVVEIATDATTGDIARRLQEDGVVASTQAFLKAAEGDSRVRSIQPGFYVLRTKISGKDALTRILSPAARKGRLEIRAGWQLHDITKTDGNVEPGIVARLANASCAELDGKNTCVPVEELRNVAQTAELAALGVPDWAAPQAARLEASRRLEGLVMPGVYDVRPGSTAEQLWQQVLAESATRMQAAGLPQIGRDTGFTPYEMLIMASLIQREGIEKDFAKVSRVTYNRLAQQKELQYDSTVNYVLDRPAIRTREEDRKKVGPYNTYAPGSGLPPGPISSPSAEAIQAAAKPVDGNWLFFVRCQKDGTSCFAETLEQHEDNVAQAQANGAY